MEATRNLHDLGFFKGSILPNPADGGKAPQVSSRLQGKFCVANQEASVRAIAFIY